MIAFNKIFNMNKLYYIMIYRECSWSEKPMKFLIDNIGMKSSTEEPQGHHCHSIMNIKSTLCILKI